MEENLRIDRITRDERFENRENLNRQRRKIHRFLKNNRLAIQELIEA